MCQTQKSVSNYNLSEVFFSLYRHLNSGFQVVVHKEILGVRGKFLKQKKCQKDLGKNFLIVLVKVLFGGTRKRVQIYI